MGGHGVGGIVAGVGLAGRGQQADEQVDRLFQVPLVNGGRLHEVDRLFHEGDGLGVFNDGAGKRRAIVEIEQGEAVVDERRGSLLDASVGVARVEGEQLAGAEAVARAVAFHNAMPLAHEAYDRVVVGVRREQLVEAGEMPELDRAAKGAAHGLAVPGVAGLLSMWGVSHLHNKER